MKKLQKRLLLQKYPAKNIQNFRLVALSESILKKEKIQTHPTIGTGFGSSFSENNDTNIDARFRKGNHSILKRFDLNYSAAVKRKASEIIIFRRLDMIPTDSQMQQSGICVNLR